MSENPTSSSTMKTIFGAFAGAAGFSGQDGTESL
jgi:hypothetical protein